MNHSRPISIHSKATVLHLQQGSYDVSILGGWLIILNDFSISLQSELSKHPIEVKRSRWPIQRFEFGQRSKRYFTFEIKYQGNYTLEFKHPETLRVKRSNVALFPPFSFFNKE